MRTEEPKFRMIKLVLILMISAVSFSCSARDNAVWNNKQAAVSLTYDDVLVEQLTNAIPLLNSLSLKATFYITPGFTGFKEHINEWKKAADDGHELGNHTLFHPCEGNAPGREWVPRDYNLSDYTVSRMADEIMLANTVLSMLDGKPGRTFAYPCADTVAGNTSYVDEIRADFVGARTVQAEMQQIDKIDLYRIPSYMINGESGDELIALVKEAIDRNALLVFLFHGVGGGHSLDVSLDAHSQLLRFLKQNEQKIWVAPLADIAGYVADRQAK